MQTAVQGNLQPLRLRRSDLHSDAIAGLTVAVVNVPQAMAHALLATVNPVLGIDTGRAPVAAGQLRVLVQHRHAATISNLYSPIPVLRVESEDWRLEIEASVKGALCPL